MKNEVYLIRGARSSGKTTLVRNIISGMGDKWVSLTPEYIKRSNIENVKKFLEDEESIIYIDGATKNDIYKISFFIKIFSRSIKFSPIFIITTQVINLKFKDVTQYITLERV